MNMDEMKEWKCLLMLNQIIAEIIAAHQIFDLTIRCVRKYIDAAAVLCKPPAAFLCKSLEVRLSGCLVTRERNCYLANFHRFSDQHKRASSELEYQTAISLYPNSITKCMLESETGVA